MASNKSTSPHSDTIALRAHALQLRIDSIRATTASKSGHPTSCMSAADMVAALFFAVMKFDKNNPYAPDNDHFIMSKGHAIPVVYAAYKGLGVISDDELLSLRKVTSPLEGHPTPRFAYNEAATGSLGQGLSIGVGYALQGRMDGQPFKTFVMMGDGEIAEGSVWEGVQLAAHYKLNNLVGIVDCNRMGQSDETLFQHHTEFIAGQFAAFGWHAITIDGHDMEQIVQAFATASLVADRPCVIVARTQKGQGLAQIAGKLGYHGKPFTPDEAAAAIEELKKNNPEAAEWLDICSQSSRQPSASPGQAGIGGNSGLKTAVTSLYSLPAEGLYGSARPEERDARVSKDTSGLMQPLSGDPNAPHFALGKTMAPRKAYGYALAALGRTDRDIVVLDADVKNSTFADIFEKDHPERFIQCFIAEQNMVSVATGLQLRGKRPFAATFGAFFTRAHDQIRMAGIGRNALRLCGSHCGVSIGEDGPSQMALEDIAMMRSIPGSVVLYPSDGVSGYALTGLMAAYQEGVSYLRTTREALPILYGADEQFAIGGCKVLRESEQDQVCIIAAGITLHETLRACDELKADGINVSVIDLYSIKPLDVETLLRVAKNSNSKVITVEDHYREGGLGEAVCAALQNTGIFIQNLAVDQVSRSGSPSQLLALAGIDAQAIVHVVKKVV